MGTNRQNSSSPFHKELATRFRRTDRLRYFADLETVVGNSGSPSPLVKQLAKALKYRTNTIRRSHGEQLGRLMERAWRELDPVVLCGSQIDAFLQRRPEVLLSLYEGLGLDYQESEDGSSPDLPNGEGDRAISAEEFLTALSKLEEGHSNREAQADLHFCLLLIAFGGFDAWRQGAREALAQLPPIRDEAPTQSDIPVLDLEAIRDPEEEPVLPETESPDFTLLDRVIIKTVVAAFNEVEGATGRDDLDDMVTELLELNESRERSSFHRGFVDALLNRTPQDRAAGDNHPRRGWYLSGFLHGQLRLSSAEVVAEALDGLSPPDQHLLRTQGLLGISLLAPLLVGALADRGKVELASTWVRLYGRMPGQGPRMYQKVLQWTGHRGQDAPGAAVKLLEAEAEVLSRGIQEMGGPDPGDPRLPYLARVRHELLQSYLAVNRFADAEAVAHELGQMTGAVDPEALALAALARLRIAGPSGLQLPDQSDRRAGVFDLLKSERATFESTVDGAPAAVLALAFLAVGEGTTAPSLIAQLQQARSRAQEHYRGSYRWWNRFTQSILELRSLEAGLASAAADRLTELLGDEDLGGAAPFDLVEEALENLLTCSAGAIGGLVDRMIERYPQRFLSSKLLLECCTQSRAARESLIAALDKTEQLTPDELWRAWDALREGALEASPRDIEAGSTALDQLETLAHEHKPSADRLHGLLLTPKSYEPAWDKGEAFAADARICWRQEKKEQARDALTRLAYLQLRKGDEDLESTFELLERWGVPDKQMEQLRRRQEETSLTGRPVPLLDGDEELRLRVLYIGGNEIQRRYEPEVRERVHAEFPGVELEFSYPGWSSNWGVIADRLEGRLGQFQAVVLHRFVRTLFGRRMRKACGSRQLPWRPCTGSGRDSIVRSIRAAITAGKSAAL